MSGNALESAVELARQMSARGIEAIEIAKVLANRRFVPNDVVGAIQTLSLPQVSVSAALAAAFPGIPRQGPFTWT